MQHEIKYGVLHRDTSAFVAINLSGLKDARKTAQRIAIANNEPRTYYMAVKYFD